MIVDLTDEGHLMLGNDYSQMDAETAQLNPPLSAQTGHEILLLRLTTSGGFRAASDVVSYRRKPWQKVHWTGNTIVKGLATNTMAVNISPKNCDI